MIRMRRPLAARQARRAPHAWPRRRAHSTGPLGRRSCGPYSRRPTCERLRGSVQHRAHARATWARGGSGSCCTPSPTSPRSARSPATRPCSWCAPGLKAIYLSRLAGRGRRQPAGQMYPDQSLYPANSVPDVVRASTSALQRADQIEHAEGKGEPLLVRADRGRRRGRLRRPAQRLRADEGDDRGRRRGRPLRGPARHARRSAATWAARCSSRPASSSARSSPRASPPTCWTCRRSSSPAPTPTAPSSSPATSTSATSRSSTGERTAEGFFELKGGLETAIARGLAYAPYADLVWCETSTPDLGAGAGSFAEGDPREVPGQAARLQLLAVVQLEEEPRRRDHRQVPARARRDGLQVPVRHAGRLPRAQLRHVRAGARLQASAAWRPTRELQQARVRRRGAAATRATRHQREVGTGYFDQVAEVISGGVASTLALTESTEAHQF